jgi:hypothetical protein
MLLFLGAKYNHNIPLKVYQVLLFFQENIQFGVNVDVTTFSDGKRETHNPAGREIDMSFHSETSFRFRANQSLLFLLNAACLAEKQQIPILVLV